MNPGCGVCIYIEYIYICIFIHRKRERERDSRIPVMNEPPVGLGGPVPTLLFLMIDFYLTVLNLDRACIEKQIARTHARLQAGN